MLSELNQKNCIHVFTIEVSYSLLSIIEKIAIIHF